MNAIDLALRDDFAAIFGGKKPAGLLNLSVNKDGTNPTNDERARVLRSRLPSPTYNTYQWFTPSPSAAEPLSPPVAGGLDSDYAGEQSPVSDSEMREAFSLKYG